MSERDPFERLGKLVDARLELLDQAPRECGGGRIAGTGAKHPEAAGEDLDDREDAHEEHHDHHQNLDQRRSRAPPGVRPTSRGKRHRA